MRISPYMQKLRERLMRGQYKDKREADALRKAYRNELNRSVRSKWEAAAKNKPPKFQVVDQNDNSIRNTFGQPVTFKSGTAAQKIVDAFNAPGATYERSPQKLRVRDLNAW